MKRGRKIKFRAWDPDEKIMANVRALVWNNGYLVVEAFSPKENELTYVPPFSPVVMQFTGLHDRNGKEIYEGDICNCREYECFGKVEWNNEEAGFYFCVVMEGGGFEEERLYDYVDELEVIGNIYENPDLLGVTE